MRHWRRKMEWVKESAPTVKGLPKGWVECNLGEILFLKNGYAFKSSNYCEDGIPVVRISDIQNGIVIIENSKKVKESDEAKDFFIEKGDILIAMSGATTGKFGIFKEDILAFQNQRVGNLKLYADALVNKQFVYHLLGSLRRDIEKKAYGGAQPNISGEKIETIKIFFPPLPEQHRIVAKIEELFSDLDKGIEQLKTAQQQLKVFRQAVLKWAFEGKLTEEWRKTHQVEPAERLLEQIKEERERHYQQQLNDWQKAIKEWEDSGRSGKKPTKPNKPQELPPLIGDELAELPQLPKMWIYTYLAHLGELARGKSKHRPRNDKRLFGGKYPFIQTGDVKGT